MRLVGTWLPRAANWTGQTSKGQKVDPRHAENVSSFQDRKFLLRSALSNTYYMRYPYLCLFIYLSPYLYLSIPISLSSSAVNEHHKQHHPTLDWLGISGSSTTSDTTQPLMTTQEAPRLRTGADTVAGLALGLSGAWLTLP